MTLQLREHGGDAFRIALGAFASSVNVITMWNGEGEPLGMTATAFSSVSVDPLLVLVCINRSTRTYGHIASSGRFGVNILSSVAREISDYCAAPGADKKLESRWLNHEADWACPALSGAHAFLDCEVDQNIEAGTHAVLIGAVRQVGLNKHADELEPLVHYRGAYRQLQSAMEQTQPKPLPVVQEHPR